MGASEIPFIVIDGLDASGKTTQAYRLTSFLESQGRSVYLRVHPSADNFFGVYAKRFLQAKGKNAHFASALFYMLDVINSILRYSWRNEDYVVFVRYLLGTMYLPSPLDKIAYHFFYTLVPKPKITFFIDVQPSVAYRRIINRKDRYEMFDEPKKLIKIRKKGFGLALLARWYIIDGSKPEVEVESKIHHLLMLQ